MGSKTSRIDIDTYFLLIAEAASLRSTCRHRKQGAALVRNMRVVATGFNGSAPGMVHCIDLDYCMKEEYGLCRAENLHGESNAITSAAKMGISTDGTTIYCMYSPCRSCCHLLKSAGIVEVKYLELYDGFIDGPDYLKELGIKVSKIEMLEVPNARTA